MLKRLLARLFGMRELAKDEDKNLRKETMARLELLEYELANKRRDVR